MSFQVGHWVYATNHFEVRRAGKYGAEIWHKSGRIVGVDGLSNYIVQFVDGTQMHISRKDSPVVMQHEYCCPLPEGWSMRHLWCAR